MLYWFFYYVMKLFSFLFLRLRFVGQENLTKHGSFIMASNHISNLDPFLLGISCRRRFGFVAKDTLFEKKISAFIFNQMGAFPIKRDSVDVQAVKEILKRIQKGCPVLLFPEGTRGVSGREKKINPGIGLIANKSGVPVIPVNIQGSDLAMPTNAKWVKRHPILVKIGQPIHFPLDLSYDEIASQIMVKIRSLGN